MVDIIRGVGWWRGGGGRPRREWGIGNGWLGCQKAGEDSK